MVSRLLKIDRFLGTLCNIIALQNKKCFPFFCVSQRMKLPILVSTKPIVIVRSFQYYSQCYIIKSERKVRSTNNNEYVCDSCVLCISIWMNVREHWKPITFTQFTVHSSEWWWLKQPAHKHIYIHYIFISLPFHFTFSVRVHIEFLCALLSFAAFVVFVLYFFLLKIIT